MKTALTILGVLVVGIVAVLLVGSGTADAPTDDQNRLEPRSSLSADLVAGNYTVNPEESSVRWTARKTLVSGYEDTGSFAIASSSLMVEGGALTDGEIIFDMADLAADQTSNTQMGVDSLTEHLRSDDFFDVETYPEASFSLTSTEEISSTIEEFDYQVTGDLTLKDQTNELTFPAEIGMDDGNLIIRGTTSIDRTQWGIRYGSDSFFDNLGDNVIGDEVDISFDLTAIQGEDTDGTTNN